MHDVLQDESLAWESAVADSGQGKSFWDNLIVRILLLAALIPLLASFGLLSYFVRPTGSLLVLHYNVYFGVDLLGLWWQVYILPILGTFFFIGHLLLARRFYQGAERIAAYLMLLASGMLAVGILIGSMSIAFINY